MGTLGRRSKLTPERQAKFLAALGLGLIYRVAAQCAGVSEQTIYLWLAKGRAGQHSRYVKFHEAVQEAEALREAAAVKAVLADPSWQSKAWFLERRYPDRWGRIDRREVTGQIEAGGAVRIELSDQLRQLLERLATEPPGIGGNGHGNGAGPAALLPALDVEATGDEDDED